MSVLIVTMAGESRRFREAGFDIPKYRLMAKNKTLFGWAVESLSIFIDDGWKLVFVGRSNDVDLRSFIAAELAPFGNPAFDLVQLSTPTDGQATTALMAEPFVKSDESIAIYNIDTYVDPTYLNPADFTTDGWIPCFPGEGSAWSFVALDADGRATEVAEKVRISDHATVGLYGFASLDLFRKAYPDAVSTGTERYIAPMYNELIAQGLDVRISHIPTSAVVPLGTPAEVEAFIGEPLLP